MKIKELLFFFFYISFCFSSVNLKIENNKVSLENNFFSLIIDPQFGAQGVSFINKETGKELILHNGKEGGLFIDHDFRQHWPGEFFKAKYDYKIIYKGENKVSVEFSCKATGEWRGQVTPSLKGLILRKIITVYSNKPFVDVKIKFYNPEKEGKDIIYWMQNIVSGNGDPDEDYYYRPSERGISVETGKTGEEWIYTPTSGWSGVLNKKEKRGIVFLMDYNYLDILYNCLSASTTEWIYEYVGIPSGKEWETDVRMVLTKGFTDYSYACKNFIFGVDIDKKLENLMFEYQIQAVEEKIPSCKITSFYVDMGKKPKLIYDTTLARIVEVGGEISEKDIGSFRLKNIEYSAIVKKFNISDKNEGQKVLKIKVEDKNFSENFESPFILGKITPFYTQKPPEKKKIILKPDVIKLNKNGKLDVLFIKTPMQIENERWRIEEIIKERKDSNIKISNFNKIAWKDKGEIENFPIGYDEILNYDLIIIQSSFEALGRMREEMIKDFVKAGGGLIILGGYFSYGKSRAEETTLKEILPFELITPFDLERWEGGKIIIKEKWLEDIFKNNFPEIIWYHKVNPKKGSKILIETDEGAPLLIEKSYGKGKILCFTPTVLGDLKGNKNVFWMWGKYGEFINKLLNYATGGEL